MDHYHITAKYYDNHQILQHLPSLCRARSSWTQPRKGSSGYCKRVMMPFFKDLQPQWAKHKWLRVGRRLVNLGSMAGFFCSVTSSIGVTGVAHPIASIKWHPCLYLKKKSKFWSTALLAFWFADEILCCLFWIVNHEAIAITQQKNAHARSKNMHNSDGILATQWDILLTQHYDNIVSPSLSFNPQALRTSMWFKLEEHSYLSFRKCFKFVKTIKLAKILATLFPLWILHSNSKCPCIFLIAEILWLSVRHLDDKWAI